MQNVLFLNARTLLSDNPQHCPHKDKCLLAFACPATSNENAAFYKLQKMKENEVDLKENRQSDTVYVVQSGAIAMVSITEGGEYNVYGHGGELRVIFPGRLVTGGDLGFSKIALMPTRLCALKASHVREIAKGNSQAQFNISRAVVWESGFLLVQLWVMNGEKVKHRVKRFLFLTATSQVAHNSENISIKITHSLLAILVNSKREVVSKALKQLSDEGFITIGYKQVVVKNPLIFFPDDEDTPPLKMLETLKRIDFAQCPDQ